MNRKMINHHAVRLLLVGLIGALAMSSRSSEAADPFVVQQTDEGVRVMMDGKLLTHYLSRSGAKPILWPVMGPDSVELTRGYPMRAEGGEHERKDHVHHRSFWFTHGDVNGVSFWHENDTHGNIVHREFSEVSGGKSAVIASVNDWIGPEGKKFCEDKRRYEFHREGDLRLIDVDVTVTASNGKVTFGDTKEGSFGVRVAGSMKVDEKLGGLLTNSEGQTNTDAWGKPARWVDYCGPVGEKTYGVAILNHPDSYGFPSHWHVRTYGLFAANPFGLKAFYKGAEGKDGTLVLAPGESFTVKYRVVLHPGDHDAELIEKQFKAYSGE
ncbi:MAG: PmoA family protein [Planctomycetota bacterium]|nr:PmoA family protein [Planctomycetota bacterium]